MYVMERDEAGVAHIEAQFLYQQSCDKHTDAFADLQNRLLEYRQAIGE